MDFRLAIGLCCFLLFVATPSPAADDPQPFGMKFPGLDGAATGEWWKKTFKNKVFDLKVPRDQVVAFALYTHQNGVLKLSAQLYPLMPDEARTVVLEFDRDGQWVKAAEAEVLYPGWSAHFRIKDWDSSRSVKYRVRHGTKAEFTGTIRRDPVDKNEIVVGVLSCNSSRTQGPRPQIINNLKTLDPDLLFFAGDQTYHHTQHTAGWIEWGRQFRDIIRDRPTITIPDDHDVGQGNIWGEGGIKAPNTAGHDGGYFYPAKYINMVQRCQTWHLPDPYDPKPIAQNITVYYTNLIVGGVDFAILEDRKFKSGPKGKIPQQGPRPDHINNENYDPKTVDLPKLKLLGDRQLQFLDAWTQDWTGAKLKVALSQTAFCGAVHLHGNKNNRLLADLDCNGWPQTGRNKALKLIRRAWAPHLCGDQHLAVIVKHGIDRHGDGPIGFTTPAIVNTIYGRWWEPKNGQAGANPVPNSPLPWTGEYQDGLGNKITMLAYANPGQISDETQRGDGFGLVRINKRERKFTVECWPRFAKVADGATAQFPGWPQTFSFDDNDGRTVTGYLPEITSSSADPVVQVIDESKNEIVYTIRTQGKTFRPRVYSPGPFTVKIGPDTPKETIMKGQKPEPK